MQVILNDVVPDFLCDPGEHKGDSDLTVASSIALTFPFFSPSGGIKMCKEMDGRKDGGYDSVDGVLLDNSRISVQFLFLHGWEAASAISK